MSFFPKLVTNKVLSTVDFLGAFRSNASTPANPFNVDCDDISYVVTDLTISFSTPTDTCSTASPDFDSTKWHRLEKDLYLHSHERSAWLQVARTREEELTVDDVVITDITISEHQPKTSVGAWESRPGGIWVLKCNYDGGDRQAVTGVDVLFGKDAVDPRPQWNLLGLPLFLDAPSKVPVAKLTVRHGKAKPLDIRPRLRVREDGKFKIVQISDTHMITGVGVCKDAIDAHGQLLPEAEADPLTVAFMGRVLDVEKPDLVILTGDQLHHDILDSQTTLYKVVAPIIERSIPFAAVFGNHDDEGTYALSRAVQMSLLQGLPFSLCQAGPTDIDGISNSYIQVFGHIPSELEPALATLFFLDSHGQLSKKLPFLGYDWIRQSQIDWFTRTSQALRKHREHDEKQDRFHLSLAFQHIPFPEYGDSDLIMRGGSRNEPTEGPKFNSSFYSALVKEKVVAVGCGHDHVNHFCALRPQRRQECGTELPHRGPWLCQGGGAGFGGYATYGEKRFHRRTQVWEIDTTTSSLSTWKRVEYAEQRVDELLLCQAGAVVDPLSNIEADANGRAA